uniref:(northern house mosquito) hypothetical protein n=1 Tax=Culex pipiens TaxID=7175 RepID=A0A8D8I4W1_CULPI
MGVRWMLIDGERGSLPEASCSPWIMHSMSAFSSVFKLMSLNKLGVSVTTASTSLKVPSSQLISSYSSDVPQRPTLDALLSSCWPPAEDKISGVRSNEQGERGSSRDCSLEPAAFSGRIGVWVLSRISVRSAVRSRTFVMIGFSRISAIPMGLRLMFTVGERGS